MTRRTGSPWLSTGKLLEAADPSNLAHRAVLPICHGARVGLADEVGPQAPTTSHAGGASGSASAGRRREASRARPSPRGAGLPRGAQQPVARRVMVQCERVPRRGGSARRTARRCRREEEGGAHRGPACRPRRPSRRIAPSEHIAEGGTSTVGTGFGRPARRRGNAFAAANSGDSVGRVARSPRPAESRPRRLQAPASDASPGTKLRSRAMGIGPRGRDGAPPATGGKWPARGSKAPGAVRAAHRGLQG
ncbi:hypothetical protein DFJ74DRAFT_686604 [Hyaloraphidium curvatum]|nr:hypothetical protein DFJ74DRAFT_686604 [Hyaloraphidium curvatum]